MLKIAPKHLLLYLIGIVLLCFGNRQFWEKIQAENKKKKHEDKGRITAKKNSIKPFETQVVVYDPVNKKWENNHISFQTIHVTNLSFDPPTKESVLTIEVNDEEYASDSQ